MFVRENDRFELARIAGRHVRERANECAGAGINVNLSLSESHPHAARRAQLARDDEARAPASKE